MDIGHSSGPFVAGVIITALNVGAGFFAAAVVCVIASLLFAGFVLRKASAIAGSPPR